MKTHLSLRTGKLDESVAFYRTLLAAEPLKRYANYALFVLQDPGLELALDRDERARIEPAAHFGIAVDSPQAVDIATQRLTSAGLRVDVERETTCCYAKQSKVWTADPDGRRWEIYYVHEETEARDGDEGQCCTSDTCDTYEQCCGAA